MKKIVVLWTFLALCLAALSASAGEGIRWQSYREGMALAQKEKKKVYLHFYADWCSYCKKMDRSTFQATEVMSYLNKHFVPVRVNTDQEKKIARRYNVRPIPDNWFIDGQGQRIANRPGYIPPEDLYLLLKYYRTDSYKKVSYRTFVQEEQ
jgi:thioredoxin-related protein